ncbi:MAG: iron-containing redox enzyme family protein [Actinobacteria bacterium]|nr:iron-containing redox enzyme family protein [Actinomycetota bacterium]MBV9254692.1 iron-containing redox enzyme family protein [Actinomycetota bacterium]MBV9665956.1 iron-containing redox enzyme family protein [Actinomycetota bacterium]
MRSTLHERLQEALGHGVVDQLATAVPVDEFDAMCTLLRIYDLWTAPLDQLDGLEQFQNHPAIAALKQRLETPFRATLDAWVDAAGPVPEDPCAAMRRIVRDSDDGIYAWLATSADWDQLLTFLAIEGGPDGGFDDMVALCQVGIAGPAKVVLGANYWDEMGRGDPAAVHTELHRRLVAAIDMPSIPRTELPLSALHRSALNGFLATNRVLQPEMLGALGLLEVQAGPRCRRVLQAFERLGAPADAFPFYEEHAVADPRHGKEWLDGAVRPLTEKYPQWGPRIVRGARWRAEANDRLFSELHRHLMRRQQLSA